MRLFCRTALTNEVQVIPGRELCGWSPRVSGRSGNDPWRRKFEVEIIDSVHWWRTTRAIAEEAFSKSRKVSDSNEAQCLLHMKMFHMTWRMDARWRMCTQASHRVQPAGPGSGNSDQRTPKPRFNEDLRPFQQWLCLAAFLQGVVYRDE
jgi:hypothetical protein